MPSLQWILVLTVTLLACLSAAAPTLTDFTQKNKELQSQLEKLNVSCATANSKFYIESDVEMECIEPMLNCTIQELKVVAVECFEEKDSIRMVNRTIKILERMLPKEERNKTQANDKCKACERYQQKPYQTFISDLKILVQKLNSKI